MLLMLFSCSRSTCSSGNMIPGWCLGGVVSGALATASESPVVSKPARLGISKLAASPSLLPAMLSHVKLVKLENPEICTAPAAALTALYNLKQAITAP